MPFNPTDLYSTSAGTQIYNYFNPFVTKFDSQSFYNYEQDNQPLFDLEERTLGLWEKSTGYFTSSLNGMPLVVSGSLDSTNRNVFTDLQTAIDSLPNIIRTPTLIEVAASGYLGGLELKNIKIVENGVLEIVNRGFAKIYTGFGNGATSSLGKCTSTDLQKRSYLNTILSPDLSSTISATSALSVATNVANLFTSRFNRTFVQEANFTTTKERNARVSLNFMDVDNSIATSFIDTGDNLFNFANYEMGEAGNIIDLTPSSLDISAVAGDTGALLQRNTTTSVPDGRQVGGLTYCNALSSLTIDNCAGPLYIRGFCIDGVSGAGTAYLSSPYKNSVGIKVFNSSPVIENCATMRNTTTGAKFVNSEVTLSRGFFADRNYLVENPGTTRSTDTTVGLHAINSKVNLYGDPFYASGSDYLFNTQNHTIGALLENSTLTGGQSKPTNSENDSSIGFSYNEVGIKALNSNIIVSGNLDIYNNDTGALLQDSHVSTDRLTVENHTGEGIVAENSTILYNNSLARRDYVSDLNGYRMTQTLFHRNGSHINLKQGSNLSYFSNASATVDIPTRFGGLRFAGSHGVGDDGSLPCINLEQSKANLIHSRIVVSSLDKTAPGIAGAAIKASDNSYVKALGTVNGATIIQGPATYLGGEQVAGVAALNGSKVSFRGPTAIVQFGVDALADANSTLEFVPHQEDDGTLALSSFSLATIGNHTSVELHSTKTCLAATDNSKIIMQDLGSARGLYASGLDNDYSDADVARFVSAGSMQFYPNANNPDTTTTHSNLGLADASLANDKMTTANFTTTGVVRVDYNYLITNPFAANASATMRNSITNGGLCVQAFGNSVVNANNIHFPTGYVQAEATFFDPSATVAGCNQLKIWNIGDTSKLYASHLAVSGEDPNKTSYHGPRAAFLSGVSNEFGTGSIGVDSIHVAYGAASGTPNTGRLSVCDLFGLGVDLASSGDSTIIDAEVSALNLAITGNNNRLGQLDSQNKGPFRVYFGTNPALRFIGYPSATLGHRGDHSKFATEDTRPLQHIAQGYSLSSGAGVFLEALNASASHNILIKTKGYNGFTPHIVADSSGYYYPSDMAESDRGTNVFLDESAANTFANAKNAAYRPLSGRANPKVSIYRSTTGAGGIGSNGLGVSALGVGLKSINIFDIRRNI
jgi:hypothetical protein|tara:strand:+ start:31159 stop:34638 length:3480 start_codon:yes stop_codon:yes gene_type:complete